MQYDWKEDFIDLCYCCSRDQATQGTMRSLVIPSLEEEAQKHRDCLAHKPAGDTHECWQIVENELNRLDRAIASARQRCQREPQQQQLFAA